MPDARSRLRDRIGRELARSCHPSASALADTIAARHGDTVAAVLFYGSCLRQEPSDRPPEGIQDFYLVVDSYRNAYRRRWPALVNALLPPNVFYLEHDWHGHRVRAKYAVISREQFRRATSARAFHPWLWARFAQPAALLRARDDGIRAEMTTAVSEAVITMLAASAPLLTSPFAARDLWLEALGQTYRAELRPESANRATLIYQAERARYDDIAPLALACAPGPPVEVMTDGRLASRYSHHARRRARRRWTWRRLTGKPLTVLRLTKSLLTFDGGVDYALWKIERHTGIKVPISGFERRHPILTSPRLLWRVYRLSAVR